MRKDIESMFLCSLIVNEFNDKILFKEDTSLLIEFVHSYIYEIIEPKNTQYNLYYGENFI